MSSIVPLVCLPPSLRYAQVFDSVGTGGTAVMVGVTKYTDKTSIRTWPLLNDEKTLTGSYVEKRREEEEGEE